MENQAVALKIVSIKNNERLLTIKWRLTMWCNYHCSYCIQNGKKESEKTDFNRLMKIAADVNRLIEESPRPVKLSLLGGEVTLYDLERLIAAIPSRKLAKIALTTNLSNSSGYYVSLANYLHSRGVKFGLCCSLHTEHVSPESFVKKVAEIKSKATFDVIKIESVLNPNTEKYAKTIEKLCTEYGIDYRFDYDRNQDDSYRSHKQNISKESHNRYTVTFEDGSVNTKLSRSQLINLGNGQTERSKFKTEKSFYCTRGMSFVYIDMDMAADQNVCIPREEYVSVNQYHIKTEPQLCHKDSCSLSGDVSVALNKEDLDFL